MSDRKGFTLIELLIVVVIIGILAAIAIPKFANTKEKAYIASVKSDLRNLITAEESYFSDNIAAGYGAIGDLGTAYNTSQGVTVVVSNNSGLGWQAVGTHTGTTTTCSVSIGDRAVANTVNDGEPICT